MVTLKFIGKSLIRTIELPINDTIVVLVLSLLLNFVEQSFKLLHVSNWLVNFAIILNLHTLSS